jgi:hypothetical protein
MHERRLSTIVSLLAAPILAACATTVSPTPPFMSAPKAPIVLATAIVAPDAVVPLVTDEVKADPQSAVVIAAAATAGVPERASEIRTAVIRVAPSSAEAVVAVTDVSAPRPAASRDIPDPRHVAMLVENADRTERARNTPARTKPVDDRDLLTPTVQTVSRIGSGITRSLDGITRSLATVTKSVRQLVEDLR